MQRIWMELAAKAFPKNGEILIPVPWNTHAGRLALTVRRYNVFITAIINAMRIMWISKAAAPATAGKRHALHLKRNKKVASPLHEEPSVLPQFMSV